MRSWYWGSWWGEQLYCPFILCPADWQVGIQDYLEVSALTVRGGSQRGKMSLLPWAPSFLPPASDYRLKEEWAGLVRTCLQPAFLPSRSGKITLLVLLFIF